LVDELKPEIQETLMWSNFGAFFKVPKEVGDDTVDLIWFKTYLAASYTRTFFSLALVVLLVKILFTILS
jgi:hypothetical protein